MRSTLHFYSCRWGANIFPCCLPPGPIHWVQHWVVHHACRSAPSWYQSGMIATRCNLTSSFRPCLIPSLPSPKPEHQPHRIRAGCICHGATMDTNRPRSMPSLVLVQHFHGNGHPEPLKSREAIEIILVACDGLAYTQGLMDLCFASLGNGALLRSCKVGKLIWGFSPQIWCSTTTRPRV